jgi:hypothetical protein
MLLLTASKVVLLVMASRGVLVVVDSSEGLVLMMPSGLVVLRCRARSTSNSYLQDAVAEVITWLWNVQKTKVNQLKQNYVARVMTICRALLPSNNKYFWTHIASPLHCTVSCERRVSA